MKEHFSMRTVAAQWFCKKCMTFTLHRVDKGRLGPCERCMERPTKPKRKPPAPPPVKEEQLELFGG